MKKIMFPLLAVAIFACNIKKVDTTKMKQAMKDHTIKRISSEDIIHQIEIMGEGVATHVNSEKTCSNPSVQFVSLSDLSNFNGKTKEVLEAYSYAFRHKEAVGNNIQKINDSTYLLTFPIDSSSFHFKNCSHQLGLKRMYLREILKAF